MSLHGVPIFPPNCISKCEFRAVFFIASEGEAATFGRDEDPMAMSERR